MGAALGFVGGLIDDVYHLKVPTGAFQGAVIASAVSSIIAFRTPTMLMNESDRSIFHSVNNIANCFKTLFDEVGIEALNKEMEDEILATHFNNNEEEFNQFLENKHSYQILAVTASFLTSKHKGILGDHCFIKFNIQNAEIPTLIELGASSLKRTEFNQTETRETTGKQLIRMLSMHRLMQKEYVFNLTNFGNFFYKYAPGITDCHTYVEKILAATNEPLSNLERFKTNHVLGKVVGKIFDHLNPHKKICTEYKEIVSEIKTKADTEKPQNNSLNSQ